MPLFLKSVQYVLLAVLLGGSGYLFYTQAAPYFEEPCKEPILYSIGDVDARFDISRTELTNVLKNAAQSWNTAAGKTVIGPAAPGEQGIPVHFIYSEEQKNSELGETIDSEQSAYDRKKAQIERLKDEFEKAKNTYEALAHRFDNDTAEYHQDVEYWNARGGAPPPEYEKLQSEQKSLVERQKNLNEKADVLNALSGKINEAVGELNALVGTLNEQVSIYNERAGDEFDQGDYVKDQSGERISIYEFSDESELTRVLSHEFGHALGIGHVENPDSIMYSYNIGTSLELSKEDVVALRAACKLD